MTETETNIAIFSRRKKTNLITLLKDLDPALEASSRMKETPREIEKIGEGGFGVVSSYQLSNNSYIAGKKAKLNLYSRSKEDDIVLKKNLRKAIKEVNTLKLLQEHKHIIKFIGCIWDENEFILFTELMSHSIKDMLCDAPLSQYEALRYVIQAADGLSFLHSREPPIVHRDIKCENMLLDKNNDNLKLADFGLALRITLNDGVTRKTTQETTEWPKFAGTLLFAAPEVRANYCSRTTYGRKADVWSLACALVQMLTGNPPYSNEIKNFDDFRFGKLQGFIHLDKDLQYSGDLVPDVCSLSQNLLNYIFIKDEDLRPGIDDVFKFLWHELIEPRSDMELKGYNLLHMFPESFRHPRNQEEMEEEHQIPQDFLKQASFAFQQTFPDWRKILVSEFGQSETIFDYNTPNLEPNVHVETATVSVVDIKKKGMSQAESSKEQERFLIEFRKLNFGGILIHGFEAQAFFKVMQMRAVDGFEIVHNVKNSDFKCDFIFIHQRLGIVAIQIISCEHEQQISKQILIKRAIEQLNCNTAGLEKLFQRMSGEKFCLIKVEGVLCMPNIDIEYQSDLEVNYSGDIINKSLLYNGEKFKKFWGNLQTKSFQMNDASIKFITAIYAYRLVKPISMPGNSMEIYRQIEQEESLKSKVSDAQEMTKHQATSQENAAPETDVISSGTAVSQDLTPHQANSEMRQIEEEERTKNVVSDSQDMTNLTPHQGNGLIVNSEQLKAIESKMQRILISGPPGTGKTLCLLLRALNAAKKNKQGRVVLATMNAQELTPKFEKFCSQNLTTDLNRVIEIDEKLIFENYSPDDDVFFDESVVWDLKSSYFAAQLAERTIQLGSTTAIAGWLDPAKRTAALKIFPGFEFFELKTIIRGTRNIIEEWISFFPDPFIRFGHNIRGAPPDRHEAIDISNILDITYLQIRSFLKSKWQPAEGSSKKRIHDKYYAPHQVAVIIGTFSFPKSVVKDIGDYLREHDIACGTIREQIKNPKLIAVCRAEDSLSYDWPIVVVVAFTNGRSDYKKDSTYMIATSRAIAKLIIVECAIDADLGTQQTPEGVSGAEAIPNKDIMADENNKVEARVIADTSMVTHFQLTYLDLITNEIDDIANSVITTARGMRNIRKDIAPHRLCLAILTENVNEVGKILNVKETRHDLVDEAGRTALHHAVCISKQSLPITLLLLKHKFDPLQQTADTKRSALHFASATGNRKLVKELVRCLMDNSQIIACKDCLGRNPLHYVSQGPQTKESAKIVDLLMSKNKSLEGSQDVHGATALHLAVNDGNVPVIESMLKYPMFKHSINVPDVDGRTVLFFAENRKYVIKLLIKNGAHVNAFDSQGCKALVS